MNPQPTSPQLEVLRSIAAGERVILRPAWGAIHASASHGSVSTMRALERHGYVALVTMPKTNGTKRAKLTPMGHRAIDAAKVSK
jgi:hypothetical protein